MNATQALSNLQQDLAELERRGTVRPGYIAARRREHETIAAELHQLQLQVENLKQRCNDEHERNLETDLRLGMLANVLNILGFDPMVHLRRPLSNVDIYYQAAQNVDELRRAKGLHNNPQHRMTKGQMKDLLANALWQARFTILLRPIEQKLQHIQLHGQERTAA
jgi:hypothetical protein